MTDQSLPTPPEGESLRFKLYWVRERLDDNVESPKKCPLTDVQKDHLYALASEFARELNAERVELGRRQGQHRERWDKALGEGNKSAWFWRFVLTPVPMTVLSTVVGMIILTIIWLG